MYYLMSVSGIDVDCTGGGGEAAACTNLNFQVLPGVDTIDGKNWGRVTRDDFVAGYVPPPSLLSSHMPLSLTLSAVPWKPSKPTVTRTVPRRSTSPMATRSTASWRTGSGRQA